MDRKLFPGIATEIGTVDEGNSKYEQPAGDPLNAPNERLAGGTIAGCIRLMKRVKNGNSGHRSGSPYKRDAFKRFVLIHWNLGQAGRSVVRFHQRALAS